MRNESILLPEKVADQSFFTADDKLDTTKLREYANESFKSYFEKQQDTFSFISNANYLEDPTRSQLIGSLDETTQFAKKIDSLLNRTWEPSKLTLEETETLLSFLDWDNLQKNMNP